MPEDHARSFGGGAADTMMSPIVLIALVLAIILILVLPRKYLVVPFFIMVFFVPLGEQFVLAGAHLFVSRIVIVVGLARMFLSSSTPQSTSIKASFGDVDKIFFSCILCQAVAVILLFHSGD